MTAPRKRVVVAISGRGSNMAALLTASRENDFPAEIVGVVSDTADAPGLLYAGSNGIPTRVVARADFASREAHDAGLDSAINALGGEIVALAGYMRLLQAPFVEKWAGRLINIHPSLLPTFPGLNTHRRALDAGCRVHGCSVHYVTLATDEGPLIAQAAVPVLLSDTEDTLAARVLKAEHRLYPLAVKLVAEGLVRLENGRAVFTPGTRAERLETPPLLSPDFEAGAANLEDLARFTP
ncbi:MAG: phosphoribosylglycinamide formyltransferase [Rhizobiaceae bacterium]